MHDDGADGLSGRLPGRRRTGGTETIGMVVVDKEAGLDLARRRGPVPPALLAATRGPRRDARSRRHRGAARGPGPLHPHAALPHRPAEVLRGRGGPRPGHEHARRLGGGRPGRGTWPASPWPTCARRPPRSPASSSRCPPWSRPARSVGAGCTSWPGPGSRSSAPPARSPSTASTSTAPAGGEAGVFRIEVDCSTGHLRPRPGRRPGRRRSGVGPTCATCVAPGSARSVSRRPTRSASSTAAHVLTPGPGPARPAAGRARRRDGALGLARARPRPGVGGGHRRRAVGAARRSAARLLAVYEATGTDRMVALCVLAATDDGRARRRRSGRAAYPRSDDGHG